MRSTHPDSLHAAVRQALQAGDFPQASQLSHALGLAISQELTAASPASRSALYSQRLAMLQENLSLAQVLRAHLAGQLQANAAACLYEQNSAHGSSWTFDA